MERILGERFYLAQLQATGSCCLQPNPNKRRKRMPWDDEKKAQAISLYEAENPTPETSIEVVKAVAEELEETVNGVRMILTKAGVYIKKAAAPAKTGGATGGSRVSKEDAQSTLKAAISDAGQNVDDDIIVKLTGKAAVYLAGVISAISGTPEDAAE
jgi:hypothetical protein